MMSRLKTRGQTNLSPTPKPEAVRYGSMLGTDPSVPGFFRNLPCFLSLLLFVSPLRSAELARWSAAQFTVNRAHDYYHRSSILLRVDKPIPQSAWLELTYLDRGYGQISIAGARDQWGIARLNTGRVRHAVFRLDPRPNPGAEIRIEGVSELQQ